MFSRPIKFAAVAVAAAGLVSAASPLDSLSATCKSTIQTVAVSSDAQCLNLGPILTAAIGGGNIDLPTVASSWLTGLCSAGACSNASLTAVFNNITSGCATDLKTIFDADVSDAQFILPYILQFYPPVRQIACLKDTSTNKLCVPETLSNLETITGSLGNLSSTVSLDDITSKLTPAAIKPLICTDCIKAAWNIVAGVFPGSDLLSQYSAPFGQVCGASFTDGQNVSTVSQTAAPGEFAAVKSGAVGFTPVMAGAVLAAISSVFVTLA
jgi:hypothetical protein